MPSIWSKKKLEQQMGELAASIGEVAPEVRARPSYISLFVAVVWVAVPAIIALLLVALDFL